MDTGGSVGGGTEKIYLLTIDFDGGLPSRSIYFQNETAARMYLDAYSKHQGVRKTDCRAVYVVNVCGRYYLANELTVFKTAKEKVLNDLYKTVPAPELSLVSPSDFKDKSAV